MVCGLWVVGCGLLFIFALLLWRERERDPWPDPRVPICEELDGRFDMAMALHPTHELIRGTSKMPWIGADTAQQRHSDACRLTVSQYVYFAISLMVVSPVPACCLVLSLSKPVAQHHNAPFSVSVAASCELKQAKQIRRWLFRTRGATETPNTIRRRDGNETRRSDAGWRRDIKSTSRYRLPD